MCDCCFTENKKWFRYRVGAIIVENDCVLLAGNDFDDYLYSVGGGVHLGETAEHAIAREVLEETGVNYEIDRLAVVHENFFSNSGGRLKGLDCHEISLYFLMKSRGTQKLNDGGQTRFGDREKMHWIPIKDLDKYNAFPAFLKDWLTKEHSGVRHIITNDR